MLVRGKYIILTIAILTVGAAAFAWWSNVEQSRQSVKFWTQPTAELLRDAATVDLLRFEDAKPNVPNDGGSIRVGNQVFRVAERKTVGRDRGVCSQLIEDASFDWEKTAEPNVFRDANLLLGLELRVPNTTAIIAIDIKSGEIFDVIGRRAAVLKEGVAKQARDVRAEQFPIAR